MKTLFLMRHAKSSWDDPGLSDEERPLNSRGQQDAPRMGRFLRQGGFVPDHVVTSSAVRANATAQLVANECCCSSEITVLPELYRADVHAWQHLVWALSPAWNSVLCVGHNPEIEEFIGTLTSHYVHMPTAAVAHLTSNVAEWPQFGQEALVVMNHVWRPKDVR
jgi:phosphohistidine phosphatase